MLETRGKRECLPMACSNFYLLRWNPRCSHIVIFIIMDYLTEENLAEKTETIFFTLKIREKIYIKNFLKVKKTLTKI
jgi:hypothetical protein